MSHKRPWGLFEDGKNAVPPQHEGSGFKAQQAGSAARPPPKPVLRPKDFTRALLSAADSDGFPQKDKDSEDDGFQLVSSLGTDEAQEVREEEAYKAAQKRYQKVREPSEWPPKLDKWEAYDRWLEGSSEWTDIVGEGWVPVKVLGRGGFGIAGLWEYKGDRPKEIMKVVVKQSSSIKDAVNEARILRVVNQSRAQHALAIYRDIKFDSCFIPGIAEGVVARIFLEFCEGGDMNDFINRAMKR
jgi:hypothetical protein